MWDLHVYAFYGVYDKFKDSISLLNNKTIVKYAPTIQHCIDNGSKLNEEFAKFCYDYFRKLPLFNIDNIMVNCLTHGVYYETMFINNYTYNCINYISKQNLTKLIKYKELNELCCYLCILNEYKDIFDKIENPILNDYSRKLISHLNLPNYFSENIEVKYRNYPPIPYKLKRMNEDEVVERQVFDNPSALVPEFYKGFNMRSSVIRNFLNEGERCPYEKSISDCKESALNDFFIFDPYFSYELIVQRLPFLYWTDYYVPLEHIDDLCKYNKNYKYSIIYSCLKANVGINNQIFDSFEFVEWNFLQIVRLSCQKHNLQRLHNVYKRTKKCYKILDFENKKYIKEEIELNDTDFLIETCKYSLSKFMNFE